MINIKMQPTQAAKTSPNITVIGVGGAGCNAVNNMVGLEGCSFLACNTDAQALNNSLADSKVQLGLHVTGGLGAGSKPEIGKAAAEESLEEVMQYLDGANMVFVTAGMGGGTGTGAAPVIAKACRERGILTVGVVTKPFHFEGSHRMKAAEAGIQQMQSYVDTLIVIPNQNLFRVANEKTTFAEAFRLADGVLQSGVRGITDLIVRPGLVNLDFADIRTAMMEMGKAMLGTGEGMGDKRAIEAAEAAINNPLLDDVSMKGAHGVIINVTGGYDMTLFEADEACNRIRDEVDPDANIIFGATFDEGLEGIMRVSIVATGIEKESVQRKKPSTNTVKTDAVAKKPATNGDYALAPQQANASPAPVFMPAAQAVRNMQAPQTLATQVKPAQTPQTPAQYADLDMFEQGEFAVSDQISDVPQNTAMRGTRYKDSFIPPPPVQAEGQEEAQRSYAPQGFHSMPPQQSAYAQTTTSPGLHLNPPKLPVGGKKRSPSLFERITGTVQQHIEGIRGEEQQQQPRPRVAPTAGMQAGGPVPQSPSQGSLNIDGPSRPAQADEELDIPAFLRRQAN